MMFTFNHRRLLGLVALATVAALCLPSHDGVVGVGASSSSSHVRGASNQPRILRPEGPCTLTYLEALYEDGIIDPLDYDYNEEEGSNPQRRALKKSGKSEKESDSKSSKKKSKSDREESSSNASSEERKLAAENWRCEVDTVMAQKVGKYFLEIDGLDQDFYDRTVPGETTLDGGVIVDGRYVVADTSTVQTGRRGSKKGQGNDDDIDQRRHRSLLERASGTKKFLVVRVVATDGATSAQEDEIFREVFSDNDVNLRTQYKACSGGKFDPVPFDGFVEGGPDAGSRPRVTNGVVTIQINTSVRGRDMQTVENTVETALARQLGDLPRQFDHVMLCLPPGTVGAIGYAYLGSWLSVYNEYTSNGQTRPWCLAVSIQLHEIGHNLGLYHSGRGSSEYADTTGIMGFSSASQDTPKACFNPAKEYQLGWFMDSAVYLWDIVDTNTRQVKNAPYSATMIGSVSYNPLSASDSNPVVIRVRNDVGVDLFVGFNRAIGPNSGTQLAGDEIVIVEQDGELGAPSFLVSTLTPGGIYSISNYQQSGKTLRIRFRERNGDTATVDIYFSECDPINCSPPQIQESCPPGQVPFRLQVVTDRFGGETFWSLTDANGVQWAEGTPAMYPGAFQIYDMDQPICIPLGNDYTFTMGDGYGDGLCCGQGNGGYSGWVDGDLTFTGGNFLRTEVRTFSTSSSSEPKSTPLTPAPILEPSPSPTTAPPIAAPTPAPTPAPTSEPSPSPTLATPTTPPTLPPVQGPTLSMEILNASFESGPEGFVYVDDAFRNSNQPNYANGQVVNGQLQLSVGGINGDDILNMSGGWIYSFDLPFDATVEVIFDWSFTMSTAYESDEWSQLLLAFDGNEDELPIWTLVGDGSGGPDSTAVGFATVRTFSAAAGSHSVTLGAFNYKKTTASEVTTATFDNVRIVVYGMGPVATTFLPTDAPSISPTDVPSASPSARPSALPSSSPSSVPTTSPSESPSTGPSMAPTSVPSVMPSSSPSSVPSSIPSYGPSGAPSTGPSANPSASPSIMPSVSPSSAPSTSPSSSPSAAPSPSPSAAPSRLEETLLQSRMDVTDLSSIFVELNLKVDEMETDQQGLRFDVSPASDGFVQATILSGAAQGVLISTANPWTPTVSQYDQTFVLRYEVDVSSMDGNIHLQVVATGLSENTKFKFYEVALKRGQTT